jgi:glycosyltransferase involved in cell wall biosynthesis
MACEVPCVATAIGDCARIIGDTGLIVPPKDADALCRAWVKILEMSEQERLNLGTAARQRVQEQFSLQSIVSQYEKLYSSALNTGDAA